MDIFLTIDTECSEERLVRGTVRPPLGYDLMMRGRLEGHPSGLGTDLIMSELNRYQFRATFFVEALCAEYFGVDGLASVCGELEHGGHDVQLHLHPNFQQPEWRTNGDEPLPDNIGEYALAQQCLLLERGIAILTAAGVPRPSIVAFRAGNYGASNSTWHALQTVGISVDSSLNLWALNKDCRMVVKGTPNDLFEPFTGIWELPISCFADRAGYRHLEITAISAAEMRYALERFRQYGVRAATIVMHPGEFFVVDDHRRKRGRPNTINIARLRSLLRFLNRSRDRFQLRTVGALAAELKCGGNRPGPPVTVLPSGSAMLRLGRLPSQLLKRTLMRPRSH
jgi:hypothetical protein